MIPTQLIKTATLVACTAFALSSTAFAASHGDKKGKKSIDFSDRPIEVVIHSSYGGGTDVTARMMMIRSRRTLDTDMYVVSKRGGSGAKAQNYVLTKPADGHTIMALTQSHLYTMAQGKSDMKIDDITGIVRAMDDPTFLVVRKESEAKTMEDLVALSKKRALNFGVAQIGGTEHIGLAQLAKAAGMKFKVVPFGSGGEMLLALRSGAIDATLPNVSEAANMIADGSIIPLVLLAEKRLGDYPDVRSSYELGYKVKTSTTRGYAVLASTPKPIIEALSKNIVKAMKHEVFGNYLATAGLSVESSVAGTDIWDKHLKEEYAKASAALKELGIIK
ncbi:tripartite tricarboxylate transporter substrate binding protein [Litorivicinus sp.]|jgi:putative tricarboxylic transport membrane protein|nr:tripartite tricarboxylate transporter substrate binding protein [Litorivicinus sp.]